MKYERREQFKSNNFGNNKIILLGIFMVIMFAVSIYTFFNNGIVYAEEETTSQNKIVNFNQIWNPTTLRSSYSGITYTNNNGLISMVGNNNNGYHNSANPISEQVINCVANHNYYVRFKFINNSNKPNNVGLRQNGTQTMLYDHISPNDYDVGLYKPTSNIDVQIVAGVLAQTYYNCSFYCILVDITLMYGENEPTLEQCNQIFTSDYYNYTTGTSIYLDGLDSYSRGYTAGFNSAWESQNVSYRQYVIGAQSFAFNNQQYTEESTKSYDAIAGAYSFGGILGIPLGFLSVGGTNYEIDFTLLCTDWSGESLSFKQEYSLYFYYVDSDNNLIQIGKIPYYEISGNYGTYKGSFVCPVDTDTIYLEFTTDSLDNTPNIATAFASNITFRSQNIESAINSAFNSGAESVKDSYLPGGDLYNEIYNLGYSNGSASNKPFTDSWDFVGQSFHGIGEILAMELIPGLPLGLFVALPLLVGLLFFIVKIAKGSGG